MNYRFSVDKFKTTFNWKSTEELSPDSCRITHHQGVWFKLFPFTANGKTPTVLEMKDVIGDFVKVITGVETPDTDFQKLIETVKSDIEVSDKDESYLEDLIYGLFYHEDKFLADNIGFYTYTGDSENNSVKKLAGFLNDVLGIGQEERAAIKNAMERYPYNALENLIKHYLDSISSNSCEKTAPYFTVFEDAGRKFKKDFQFMLKNDMSDPEDLSDLLALYYLYYTSQTCITLDHFGNGDRTKSTKIFFALDWEKVSANRECCKGGWKMLRENVSNIFSHAVTLELLNQTENPSEVFDYKLLSDSVEKGDLDEKDVATEIKKIENIYKDSVGDYKEFSLIPQREGKNKADIAMRHLFECVKAQFVRRKAANDKYVKKLSEFYKKRWLKNRKKAGYVFNLTERDIIFLTKISIQEKDRIRLTDLFSAYGERGVYLDNASKALLQEFFTKLNLLDKKSDSGDAQYVKRIL